jgi:hypothetical protein
LVLLLLAPCKAPINSASPSAPDEAEFFLPPVACPVKAPVGVVVFLPPFAVVGVAAFLPPFVESEEIGVVVIPPLPPTFVV